MQPLAEVRILYVGQAHRDEVSQVRQSLHGGEVAQSRPRLAVPQRRVQAQGGRAAGSAATATAAGGVAFRGAGTSARRAGTPVGAQIRRFLIRSPVNLRVAEGR